MTTPDWYAADEDDADRTRSDLTVWRDRGQIIATQQTRIAQLEAMVEAMEQAKQVSQCPKGFYCAEHDRVGR